jgi:HEAT repeat protein
MKPGPNGGKLAILITGAELPGKTADRVDADKPPIDSDLAAARVVASVLLIAEIRRLSELISTRSQTRPMSDFVQLDLFGDRPNIDRPTNAALLQSLLPQELSDEELIAALPEATLADACALAAEAGTRRLSAAIPALVTLCNRFVGYGIDVGVPEQAAALEALGVIGGPEASRAVVQLIVKRIVQGPTLVVATAVASQVGVIFPTDIALAFLRDSNPSVRALTCACVRAEYEVVATLIAMLDDPDGEVSAAAACALGRMGRVEARIHLKRYLTQRPSGRVVEAVAAVADDEAIVLLARVGRARPDLAHSIISTLEEIDSPRAASAALGLKGFVSNEERR